MFPRAVRRSPEECNSTDELGLRSPQKDHLLSPFFAWEATNCKTRRSRANSRAGAVWFARAMGLLDDAIREHLELKRRRGADPGAVAREERDALGLVHRDEADRNEGMDTRSSAVADDREALGAVDSPRGASSADSASRGQETVEINMEAELAAERGPAAHANTDLDARVMPVTRPGGARAMSDESLEWDAPDRADDTRPNTGLSSGSDVSVGGDEQNEPIEDVLEKTPDFLRETPEQERLWFEQRPPRDFDFNE
jgi:hypothetical protein